MTQIKPTVNKNIKERYIQVKSINELKKICNTREDNSVEGFISLNFGARSTKNIVYLDGIKHKTDKMSRKKWEIFNAITGDVQLCTERELKDLTNIVEAMKVGAFWVEK